MSEIDIKYLCTTIGNLAGVPVRIFEEEKLVFFYFQSVLPCDPMNVYHEEIFAVKDHVGYISTRHFHYYGIVNWGETKIVIGPARQVAETDQELRELAFRAGVSREDMASFMEGMKSIIRLPLESILQMLCTLNHVLNGEKISLTDLVINDKKVEALIQEQGKQESNQKISPLSEGNQIQHNSFDQEQLLLHMVRTGDTAAMREWFAGSPAIRSGVLAKEQLRQRKNIFIVTATLVSRAAIRGGMDADDAFTLSDSYIQQCELSQSTDAIAHLQYRMLLDYTERVERLRLGRQPSRLTQDVANYIQHHISEPITAKQLAEELYLSRPYLSRRFKEETGDSLTDFILKEKTEEAKRLLRYSDRTLTAISNYLGFSSPSHFSRVFHKYASMSPSEYRQKVLR